MFCIRIQLTNIYWGSAVYHYIPSTAAKNWSDTSLPLFYITEISPGVTGLPTGAPGCPINWESWKSLPCSPPQKEVTFNTFWKGESSIFLVPVSPRHTFPAPQSCPSHQLPCRWVAPLSLQLWEHSRTGKW